MTSEVNPMTIQVCKLDIRQKRKENEDCGKNLFPLNAYYNDMDCYPAKEIPWHWHEEVEVIYMREGSINILFQGTEICLKENEGIYINANQLHRMKKVNEGTCVAYSFVFSPTIISGGLNSVYEQRFVKPLIQCKELPYISFTSQTDWGEEASKCILQAFIHYGEECYAYEILIRDQLSRMWYLMLQYYNSCILPQIEVDNIDLKRMKVMLEYIHNNFNEPLRIKELASIVSISERECLRCFQNMLSDTPIQYLLKYRISKAVAYLEETSNTITEISTSCGFDDPSYFSKIFKRFIHMSPSEYRKKEKH